MNKTMIVVAILITLFYLWFTDTINKLMDDTDVSYGFKEKALVTGEKYTTSFDDNGNELIVLKGVSLQEKKELWSTSDLKKEMLELFPNFVDMKNFVEDHVESDGTFKSLLLKHIENIEFQYIGASLTGEEARAKLANF